MKFKIIFCGLMLSTCVGVLGAQEYCIKTYILCENNYTKLINAEFKVNDNVIKSISNSSCSGGYFVFSVVVDENDQPTLSQVLSNATSSTSNGKVKFTITPQDTSAEPLDDPSSTVTESKGSCS